MSLIKPALIAAILATPALAVGAAEVTSGEFGAWRFEAVSNIAPGGERRVACSVATGPEGSPTVFVSFASVDMMAAGEFSGFTFAERGIALGKLPVGSAAEIAFRSGSVSAPGKITISGSPDGETTLSEAYPAETSVDQLLNAMLTNGALKLVRGEEALREVRLDGFADAYAAAAKACHLDSRG